MCKKILIKGAGEHASGTAHRLFNSGFQVVMTDLEQPTAVRRKVSFCSAIFENSIEIEGVFGTVHTTDDFSLLESFTWSYIPVFVDPKATVRQYWKPDVVIDARIMKRNIDTNIDDAPLVIAFGPGFQAAHDCHLIIETNRGHELGRIISHGMAEPDTGIPGDIAGCTDTRVFRSPTPGCFTTTHSIGDIVTTGETIGNVGKKPLVATIAGVLRGLLKSELTVTAGQKLGDIDPRNERRYCYTLSDKTRTISGGTLEAILSYYR